QRQPLFVNDQRLGLGPDRSIRPDYGTLRRCDPQSEFSQRRVRETKNTRHQPAPVSTLTARLPRGRKVLESDVWLASRGTVFAHSRRDSTLHPRKAKSASCRALQTQ